MRQILVERARARGAQKRWAGLNRVSMTDALAVASEPVAMLPALDDALTRLEAIDPEQARIVELRYFAGLSIEDTADALGMSPATLKRRWALARAWLFREMSASHDARAAAPRPRSVRGGARSRCRPTSSRGSSAKRQTIRSCAPRCSRCSTITRAPAPFWSQPIVEQAADLLADEEPLAPAHLRRRLHDRPRARPRRHGPRLPGVRRAAGPDGRAEGARAAPDARSGAARAAARAKRARPAALTHPGICTVYALEEIDGDLYIATEFVDGHTLGEEIRAGRRPTRDEMCADGARAGGGAGQRAREGHRPSRSQAGQRHARARRPAEDSRLRPGANRRRRVRRARRG